ncbi:MAG TPA: hypothetical protein VLS93_12310 [Anaeromyxobacteraceae bacterium]|nr:hypothetical protein [Anaeromyxobacteraceae bacterium]
MSPPCCSTGTVRRTRRILLLLLAAAAVLAPLLARSQEPELVAEAHFLCDTLPPGGRDVNLSVVLAEGEPDPATGEASLTAYPRVQLAVALGERVGFTADVGLAAGGELGLDAPGAALKVLLRSPEGGRIGLAASLDLYGSTHSLSETEVGVGLGAIRAVGPLALRASASVASGIRSWSPHLHAGASAALALGERWRALAEVVAEVGSGEVALTAGPTLKLALGERTTLMAGALLPLGGSASPVFSLQLARSM